MITVLAGVNGAGKSSILGMSYENKGAYYFNPDEAARILLQKRTVTDQIVANSRAWEIGYQRLNTAIDLDENFAFETTLGGNKIFQALMRAVTLQREVQVSFVGLATPELHIQRVAERVNRGGHPIDEAKIRERWETSRANMVELIASCHSASVFDNSLPLIGGKPQTVCLFRMQQGVFLTGPTPDMPEWAKPLAAAAMKRALQR